MDFFTHHYCAYYKEAKKKTNSAKRFLKNSGENWLNLFSYSQYFEKSTYELLLFFNKGEVIGRSARATLANILL